MRIRLLRLDKAQVRHTKYQSEAVMYRPSQTLKGAHQPQVFKRARR
jgi:hypothetical protein